MYEDILIPTWELALVMLTCGLIGWIFRGWVEKWRKTK